MTIISKSLERGHGLVLFMLQCRQRLNQPRIPLSTAKTVKPKRLLQKNSALTNPSRSLYLLPRATPPRPVALTGQDLTGMKPPAGSRDRHLDLKRLVATDKTPASTAIRRGGRALGDHWQPASVRVCFLVRPVRSRRMDGLLIHRCRLAGCQIITAHGWTAASASRSIPL